MKTKQLPLLLFLIFLKNNDCSIAQNEKILPLKKQKAHYDYDSKEFYCPLFNALESEQKNFTENTQNFHFKNIILYTPLDQKQASENNKKFELIQQLFIKKYGQQENNLVNSAKNILIDYDKNLSALQIIRNYKIYKKCLNLRIQSYLSYFVRKRYNDYVLAEAKEERQLKYSELTKTKEQNICNINNFFKKQEYIKIEKPSDIEIYYSKFSQHDKIKVNEFIAYCYCNHKKELKMLLENKDNNIIANDINSIYEQLINPIKRFKFFQSKTRQTFKDTFSTSNIDPYHGNLRNNSYTVGGKKISDSYDVISCKIGEYYVKKTKYESLLLTERLLGACWFKNIIEHVADLKPLFEVNTKKYIQKIAGHPCLLSFYIMVYKNQEDAIYGNKQHTFYKENGYFEKLKKFAGDHDLNFAPNVLWDAQEKKMIIIDTDKIIVEKEHPMYEAWLKLKERYKQLQDYANGYENPNNVEFITGITEEKEREIITNALDECVFCEKKEIEVF